ncbi:MAG: phospholipase D-like domain-containing protein, partial [Tepidisphaeraceae bacterium]
MLKRIPYVIDNDKHKLGDILALVLDEHHDLAMDIATAYFNIQGYEVLAERLKRVGSLRLLLGAEPDGSIQIGIQPDPAALKAALRGDLSREPYSPKTLKLVEDLTRFARDPRVQIRLFDKTFLHAKCYLFYGDPRGGPLFERFRPVLGVVGSSNFTGPGLMRNRELNLVHKGIIPEEEVVDERGRQAALSHYTKERSDVIRAETEMAPYEADAAPKVSSRISFESRRVIKGEVGAAALWELAEWFDVQWRQAVEFKEDFLNLLDTSKFG